jgi:hypothetical protein
MKKFVAVAEYQGWKITLVSMLYDHLCWQPFFEPRDNPPG